MTRFQICFKSALIGISAAVAGAGFTAVAADTASNATEGALDLRPGDEADVCDPSIPQIRVTVNGVEPYGILLVEIYRNDPKNFLSSKGRIARARVAAEIGPQTVCLNIDGPGMYAVASYHDRDGDRKLDKKWNRLPKEPFALSTNPKLKLRKPRFREAAFEAGELGADIKLDLRRI
ncbi:MAG: DUF2141 domain-containing protein [Pseudomonadota bacterium]